MSTRIVEKSGRPSKDDKNGSGTPRAMSFQERLNAIRETKIWHTSVKQQAGPRDNDDWGQIPITTEEYHFQPITDHPKGYVLGPRDCGRNFRLFLEAAPPYVDRRSSLLGGYYLTFNQYVTKWDPDRMWSHLVEEQKKYRIVHGIDNTQHFLPDSQIGIDLGFGGLLEKIERYRKINTAEEQQAYYDGLTEFVHGIQGWIGSHVEEARRMAAEETNPQWKANLRQMAEMNERLITEPPSTFQEVLQWLAWYQMAKRAYIGGGPIGRIDVFLNPFWLRESEAGTLTEDEAIFHLACFFVKDSAYIQVGGVDEEGRDVTNPVSFMVLEASHRLKIPANIAVMVHDDMDPDLMKKAVELLFVDKMGIPRFAGQKSLIEGCVRNGFSLKVARQRVQAGCHWFALPGTEYGFNDVVKINFAAVFEVAFYEMMGDPSRDPSVSRLWNLFERHLIRAIEVAAEGIDFHIEWQHKFYPELALSLLCHGPIEKGVDASHGGVEYTNIGVDGSALATAADSFAAVEVMVEQQKKVSWNRLLWAIQSNWRYDEEARRLMMSVPAYGRGGTPGDRWADRISETFTRLITEKPTPDGHKMAPGFFSWANTMKMGKEVGATPDGRYAHDPISFGTNPNSGRTRGGSLVPTTMSTAIARVQPGYGNPAPFQFDVDPGLVSDEDGVEKFEAIIRAHFNLGGTLINANILDKETIKDAYKNPQKYPDLVVRVTGFSAYFASLSEEFRKLVYNRIVQMEDNPYVGKDTEGIESACEMTG
jgi:formate C-acetyltransferase